MAVYEIVVTRGEVYEVSASSEEEALEIVLQEGELTYSVVESKNVWEVKP